MKDEKEFLVAVSALFHGRPVRWAHAHAGDYDGRERTLEVFNADAAEQRELIKRMRSARAELEARVGGAVVLVFHTRSESARLYAEFVEQALCSEVVSDIAAAEHSVVDDPAPLAIDIGLIHRQGDQRGSTSLPRKAA